jgi:hypothetical protein
MPKLLLVTIVVLCSSRGLLAQTTATRDALVAVKLASGREFSGTIDATSTAEQLVLRTSASGITVRRPIRWERLAAASLNGQPAAVEEVKRLAVAGSRESGGGSRGAEVERIELRGVPSPPMPPAEAAAVPVLPPVAMIAFDAFIANWDGDVETDGLILDLLPLDQWGDLVPASGTVEVELFASQRRTMHHAPLSGGDTFERVERWSLAVEQADIGASGVRLRLPFGAIQPELDFEWLAYNYGLVHVRFVVPGSGVFDDSRDGIRIRPWAPNRDYLEMNTNRRFLPTERLGRTN